MQGSPGEAVKEQHNTQSGEPVLREQSLERHICAAAGLRMRQ